MDVNDIDGVMNMKELIEDFEKCNPADINTIKEAEIAMGRIFPDEYKEFLLNTNGIEGPIGEEEYVCIWPIDEIVELNESYSVQEFMKGVVYFGSDGGDIAYGFDYNYDVPMIIEIPFESIHIEDAKICSNSFIEFIKRLKEKEY